MDSLGWIVLLIVVGFFAALMWGCSSPPARSSSTGGRSDVAAAGSSLRVTGPSWFGCRNPDKFRELNGYLVDQDRTAFIRSVGRAYRDGECLPLEDGEEVIMVDYRLMEGLARLRRPGETESWWTYSEAAK